eukprot:CAMPEP_0194186850 /NCGR_PEP_ID=MMETSP0154-20130528/48569_1 /TAXON_ID=1049557 /ORGANISM="Thalassiothrix antarctica, Strain L6-D1" /LENGTH=35 /DNA_ID= /DNA_START= /DNA_END= /DNA_ORIENTATION=
MTILLQPNATKAKNESSGEETGYSRAYSRRINAGV